MMSIVRPNGKNKSGYCALVVAISVLVFFADMCYNVASSLMYNSPWYYYIGDLGLAMLTANCVAVLGFVIVNLLWEDEVEELGNCRSASSSANTVLGGIV